MAEKSRIHIIELDYHPDILTSFLRLTDRNEFFTIVSTKAEIYNKLPKSIQESIDELHLLGVDGCKLEDISSVKGDLHVFNTLASNYSFWAKNLPEKHIIRIHNIHTWFDPYNHISYGKSILEWRKSATHILYRRWILNDGKYIEWIRDKANFFSFMSDGNAEYVRQNYPAFVEKIGPVFPNAWCEDSQLYPFSKDDFRILIPGTPEFKRKDFTAIENLISWAAKQNFHIQIDFAGKAPEYMYSTLDNLKNKGNANLKIQYFKEFLSNDTFDEMLDRSDLLFFPIKSTTRFKIFEEKYGSSKISGSENDFIRFGKPALLPDFYPLKSDLLMLYNIENLEERLDGFIEDYSTNFEKWERLNTYHQSNFNMIARKEQHNVYLRKLVAFYGKN